MAKIEIQPEGSSWAIKHDGGYLGFVQTREEAESLAAGLVAECTRDQARSPLHEGVEDRFARGIAVGAIARDRQTDQRRIERGAPCY